MVSVEESHRRIERLAASAGDATALRVEALDEMRRVVGFDAHVWLLTDPVTAVGAAPLADIPCLPELPLTIRLKYLTAVNRWTDLAAAGASVGLLRHGTGDDPARSPQWRGVLDRYGIGDVASVVFHDRFGIWGFLDLWRAGDEPYDGSDAAYLQRVAASLTAASRAVQARSFSAPSEPRGRELGPMVTVLDDDLRVLHETAASQEWLGILLEPVPGRRVVPASVYNVAAQLLAVEQGVDTNPAMARVHLAAGFWVTLRAARLTAAGSRDRGGIAVTMEESSAAERLEVFARAFGLSPRQTEVLATLLAGLDTRAVARDLGISEYTVQDHLTSIFARTGAPTRQVLVARATGR